jgi:hypothetical protein
MPSTYRHILYTLGTLALVCGIAPTTSHAATYYVDNTVTDTNTASAIPDCTNYNVSSYSCGSGSDSTFATIADINTFSSLQPGDSVLFRRGQTWREQLTVPASGEEGSPITFGAFGEGEKPVISGADVVSVDNDVELATGSVFRSNIRLSGLEGVAFVDFSLANALTPYSNAKLEIIDSTGIISFLLTLLKLKATVKNLSFISKSQN